MENDNKMYEASVWEAGIGGKKLECSPFRSVSEAKSWLLSEIEGAPAGAVEGLIRVFRASDRDYADFDKGPKPAFQDRCRSDMDDPLNDTLWGLEKGKLKKKAY